ncbi:unnamed protein product [Adineta steineri]|uniref:Alpha/beta hydrolase fold-3 domain-containing protein n=1 Tax=Adineta steineri TaxID=433720 RepID=A0A819VJP4_9BILA|nr:unnamed protein product [Adineta steineri]CAF3742331.1 unnamed protein product [Adineta steineri]CAF4109925.1 unnamed protein product [Adineta steineri]
MSTCVYNSSDPRFTNETIAFLQLASRNASPQGNSLEVKTMRQGIEYLHHASNEKFYGTFKGTLEESTVKTNSTEIPITVYIPTDANKEKLGVYFHGGGWVIGSRKSHQTIVNTIADATKTIWISVEYRLAPEHKYPIWLDDCCDVTQYIIQNKTNFGVNETAKVGVAGDSAGGMISASIARTIKGIGFQILIYAGLDITRETPSYNEFTHQMYVLTPELMDWLKEHAFETSQDLKDPRISALYNTSLQDVPLCLFIVAELDPLRDGSLEYQKLLEKAGVQTKLLLVKGVIHGYFSLPGIFPQAVAESINTIQDFMASI